MSTLPFGWMTPKTNYKKTDTLTEVDINTINKNVNAIENGEFTLQPQPPIENTGNLRQFLDWIAYQIGRIKGEDWTEDDKSSLKNSFWIHGEISPGAHVGNGTMKLYCGRQFVIVPPGKKLVLTRVMYCADLVFDTNYYIWISMLSQINGPLGVKFVIEAYELTNEMINGVKTEIETLSSFYAIARPSGSEDLYCGDDHISYTLITNNTGNDKEVVVKTGLGHANINTDVPEGYQVPPAVYTSFLSKYSIVNES